MGFVNLEEGEERKTGIMFKRSAGWNTEKTGSVSWTKPVAKKGARRHHRGIGNWGSGLCGNGQG